MKWEGRQGEVGGKREKVEWTKEEESLAAKEGEWTGQERKGVKITKEGVWRSKESERWIGGR